MPFGENRNKENHGRKRFPVRPAPFRMLFRHVLTTDRERKNSPMTQKGWLPSLQSLPLFAETAKFPCKFPVIGEIAPWINSLQTASGTTSSTPKPHGLVGPITLSLRQRVAQSPQQIDQLRA